MSNHNSIVVPTATDHIGHSLDGRGISRETEVTWSIIEKADEESTNLHSSSCERFGMRRQFVPGSLPGSACTALATWLVGGESERVLFYPAILVSSLEGLHAVSRRADTGGTTHPLECSGTVC